VILWRAVSGASHRTEADAPGDDAPDVPPPGPPANQRDGGPAFELPPLIAKQRLSRSSSASGGDDAGAGVPGSGDDASGGGPASDVGPGGDPDPDDAAVAAATADDADAPRTPKLRLNSAARIAGTIVTGLSSGFFAGLYGVGGPPLMVFRSVVTIDPLEARATFAASTAVVLPIQALALLWLAGQFDSSRGLNYVAIAVFSLLGLVVGNMLAPKLTPIGAEAIIVALLYCSAAVMLSGGEPAIFGSALAAGALLATAAWFVARWLSGRPRTTGRVE
jgi:hypothetical protein